MSKRAVKRTRSKPHRHVKTAPTSFGLGVFLKRSVKKGEAVGLITGEVRDADEHESAYCMDLGHNLVLEPRNVFRRMNHSCDPNCVIVTYDDPKDHRIIVEALRNIEEGEELTIDYAWSAEHAIPCDCGTHKCRGWIVSKRDLPKIREGTGKLLP